MDIIMEIWDQMDDAQREAFMAFALGLAAENDRTESTVAADQGSKN